MKLVVFNFLFLVDGCIISVVLIDFLRKLLFFLIF